MFMASLTKVLAVLVGYWIFGMVATGEGLSVVLFGSSAN